MPDILIFLLGVILGVVLVRVFTLAGKSLSDSLQEKEHVNPFEESKTLSNINAGEVQSVVHVYRLIDPTNGMEVTFLAPDVFKNASDAFDYLTGRPGPRGCQDPTGPTSEITLTLPDGIFPEAIPGSTVHVTLKPADIPVSGAEVVSFTVESKEKK